MGGYGGGFKFFPKKTVEGCRNLSVTQFLKSGILRPNTESRGSVIWTCEANGEQVASIEYELHVWQPSGLLRIFYTNFERGEKFDYFITLVPTSLPWGGVRWWFICPLSFDGKACRRRVSTLYNPPGLRYFACRHCYELTYQSCQDSHKENMHRAAEPKRLWNREMVTLRKDDSH